jgi:S1-C subfamily serine protease
MPPHVQILGTGFMVSFEGLIATSRHVVGDMEKGLCIIAPRYQDENMYQDTTDASFPTLPTTVKEIDPIKDITILSFPITQIRGSLPPLGSLDDVGIGEELQIWGYPHATEGRCVLKLQRVTLGAKVLLGSKGIKLKHGVLNVQSRPGQSGSPVIHPRTNSIVGMLQGAYGPPGGMSFSIGTVRPAELHQTTHCISAEYIRQMI